MAYIINGKRLETDEDVREYCAGVQRIGGVQQAMDNGAYEVTGGKLRHDFRLQAQANKAPVSALIEMLRATGNDVQEA